MRKSKNLDLFLWIYVNLSLLLSFFLCLSCLLAVLLPTLSSLFCMELWVANFLGRGQINLQRVVCKQRNWQWIFPQNVTFFSECNSDRIGQNIQKWDIAGKIYLWSCCCLSIYTLWAEVFRSSSISHEGLKGALCDEIKLEQYSSLERIEFRNTKTESWVSRNQHVLYSPLERISGNDLFLEKHNNNHSQLNWMHGPTDLASLYKYNLS